MAQSSARRCSCQNHHNGKDKLASRTPTKGSNCHTPAPTAIRALTPAVAPVIALFFASGSIDSFVVRYLKDDLQ